MTTLKLPIIKNKKKINIKEFKELARKVRDSLEKEKAYLEEKSKSITDLLLGQQLLHYPNKLFLLTKNTTDFPTTIFKLASYMNLLLTRSIQNYGVYNYLK